MHLTVAKILALPIVEAGDPEVIGGGSLDRTVRWVHVSDLPDLSNLLQGGELVLTTGRSLLANPTLYLSGLAAAGATGLVVELNGQVLSKEVADAADRLSLPVIALHQQIRFVEVTEEVHRTIVAEQYNEVTFARYTHEVFTDLSMKRASLGEIVDAAAEMLDAPIVLEGLNRQVLAFAGHGIAASDLLGDWERRSRLTPLTEQTTTGGPEGWTTTPVGAHRQAWGRLAAPVPIAIESRARTVLERTAQALALHRMVEQNWTALEQQAQNGLIDDLRRGRINDESETKARASALGLRPSHAYVPMTIRLVESTGMDQILTQRRRTRALDAILHTIRSNRWTTLTAHCPTDQIDLILSPPPSGGSQDDLSHVCSEIRTALARLDTSRQCAIGVASESPQIMDAAEGLSESAYVAEVALSLPQSDKAFHQVSDVRLRGLIALIHTNPHVQTFAENELRGLLEHHARYNDDKLRIFQRFLDLGGNKAALAKHLHMSRPTLYAKLGAIQRILKVDLDDAESRTSLHTAMLILDRSRRDFADERGRTRPR